MNKRAITVLHECSIRVCSMYAFNYYALNISECSIKVYNSVQCISVYVCIIYLMGIIVNAFNLTVRQNFSDLSIYKLIINNYIQYRQWSHKSFRQVKICQVQLFTNSSNLNAVNNTHYTVSKSY